MKNSWCFFGQIEEFDQKCLQHTFESSWVFRTRKNSEYLHKIQYLPTQPSRTDTWFASSLPPATVARDRIFTESRLQQLTQGYIQIPCREDYYLETTLIFSFHISPNNLRCSLLLVSHCSGKMDATVLSYTAYSSYFYCAYIQIFNFLHRKITDLY